VHKGTLLGKVIMPDKTLILKCNKSNEVTTKGQSFSIKCKPGNNDMTFTEKHIPLCKKGCKVDDLGIWKGTNSINYNLKGKGSCKGVLLPNQTCKPKCRKGWVNSKNGILCNKNGETQQPRILCVRPGKPAAPETPAKKKCLGDADGNKKVDVEDLLKTLASYGHQNRNDKADFDNNNKVNIEDLLILLGSFGAKC
jgi:hypothetical protein